MISLTGWISVPTTFLLLLHSWRAKVYASENSEDEIDFTYLIIGVTLGAFLAIGFIAVIICMIKKQMLDNVFGESDGKMERRQWSPINRKINWLFYLILSLSCLAGLVLLNNLGSNMGSSQNRDDINVLGKPSTNNQ